LADGVRQGVSPEVAKVEAVENLVAQAIKT
jgi:hypothetical protein